MLRSTREVGMAIRRMRLKAGLSQEALAETAGVSRRWLLNLENGKPTAELSLVLDCLNALEAGLQITAKDGTPWQF